ncbi:MAG: universal stress protein [Ilumatobacter sp.]|uniref:universal stress protein n=1 Tax=Ilumatobacter sp. TaxID=1967498 RepID=UPI0032990A82
MVQHLIVPVDGSPESWRAFDVALPLAERTGSDIRIVEVAGDPVDGRSGDRRLREELAGRGPFDVDVTADVRLTIGSVADELSTVVDLHPGAVIVMSSHGKGRSAALVGSVTEDVIHQTFGPIVLVGPRVEPDDVSGPVVVTVDGSRESEIAIPLAVAWSTELRSTPWIVHVAAPATNQAETVGDVFETAYTARLARDMTALSGHVVQFDELHGRRADRAITEFADTHDASMIVASSHGRSGLTRFMMGSVTAGLVRNATCPVVVVRLPHPVHVERSDHMWAY